ncbi:hypothetical protein DdX_09648 [Ditylenchus destructor]|uniref:Uncharacterized protein n=1 Tax=Ditylenchus destructor TaxID=166010 RepID=A0AAD4R684_9BILA|nr:hypothetical protein DdX_09648 [Ditylenchus destructor]
MSNATDEKYNAAESEGDRMLNHCRICQLLSRATRVLGVIFCLRWYRYIKFEKEQFGEVHGRKWKNGPDPCGNLLYKLVKDNDKVSDVVKNKLRENDIDDWDVTVLNCAILTVSNALWGFGNWPEKYKEVGKKLKILTDTRNHLQHLSKCQLTNAEFSHYWSVIADVLISFGYDADKLDKLKNWLMQLKFVPSKPLDTLPRAERLKEKANHLYKACFMALTRNQFTESIRIYSKILAIPELSDENRARILTRRSNAYLMEKGRHSYSLALQDAEEAVQTFTNSMVRPFVIPYNPYTKCVVVLNNKPS